MLSDQLGRRGVSAASADHVSSSLVETSLRGVDSHGINLYPYYVTAVEGGRINPTPTIRVVSRRQAVGTLDGDHGFGHHTGSEAIRVAIEMADSFGVGAVGVRNSTHFGSAAYFAQQAARQGYAALVFTNADALVKAFGGVEPFFGTNPICFSVPIDGEEPFCLDMATSRVSWNKIVERRRANEPLLPGWACDQLGEPTLEPDRARMLEPAADYKGYGLGMMVEILCSILMSGPIGKDLLPMYGSPLVERRRISHFFVVLRIADFLDLTTFSKRMASLAGRVRSLQPRGVDTVMVPGDPEKRAFAVRSQGGIPVHRETYEAFLAVSRDFADALCR
jgi:ureidoglycolate dehydrogenase (NAD+)